MLAAKVVKITYKITFTAIGLSAMQQWNVQTQKHKICFYVLCSRVTPTHSVKVIRLDRLPFMQEETE
jgi:hypothetical protein